MEEKQRHGETVPTVRQRTRLLLVFGLGGTLWLSPIVLELVVVAFAFRMNESMLRPLGGTLLFFGFLYALIISINTSVRR